MTAAVRTVAGGQRGIALVLVLFFLMIAAGFGTLAYRKVRGDVNNTARLVNLAKSKYAAEAAMYLGLSLVKGIACVTHAPDGAALAAGAGSCHDADLTKLAGLYPTGGPLTLDGSSGWLANQPGNAGESFGGSAKERLLVKIWHPAPNQVRVVGRAKVNGVQSDAQLVGEWEASGGSGGLSISDTLNAYQLYGKETVCLSGDSKTADGGDIGSDVLVEFANANNRVGGSLASGGNILARENLDVAGGVNARGDFTLENTGNTVAGKVNVGGSIVMAGGNPMANVFGDSLSIGGKVLVAGAWATNTYLGMPLAGSVDASTALKPAGMRFGVNGPFPSSDLDLPDTVVDYDASRGCATPSGARFNMSLCGLGGSSTDTVLAPGRYGDFVIADDNRLYFAAGTYQFRSLTLKSDGTRMGFLQGGKGLTRLLVHGDFTILPGNYLIAPDNTASAAFTGSVLIYANGKVQLGDDAEIWATVIAPNADIAVESGVRLFGQIFGRQIHVENGFDGSAGKGRFIPLMYRGLRYSTIHYAHPL